MSKTFFQSRLVSAASVSLKGPGGGACLLQEIAYYALNIAAGAFMDVQNLANNAMVEVRRLFSWFSTDLKF